MASGRTLRALSALAVAVLGLFLAAGAGAPLAAALAALVAGLVAGALIFAGQGSSPSAERPIETTGLPPLPDATELLELVDDPMLIVRNRRILFANSAARGLLGEHIAGIDVRLAIRHPAAAERLIDRGSPEPAERSTRTELIGLGEHDRRWEMTTSLLRDGSRLVRLTDRSAVQASEQMRTDFVANASHELRTPLATLLGFLETLKDDDDAARDEKTRSRFVRIMFDEARRMHRLVDDLISLSRIEAERFSPPRDSVALLPLVEEVRTACALMVEETGSDILVEDRIGDPVVLGDRAQLTQMLQNLVANALKYGRVGTPVTVRFEEAGEMLRMSVEDKGEGIAPEHLPRLTERFYRVDPGRSRAIGGTGLGLAIVKHIAQRHRGRLDISSRPGEGTSVSVHLPRTPAPLSSKSHESVTEDAPKPT